MHPANPWPVQVVEARAVQESLRGRIIAQDRFGKISTVAGIDVGFERHGTITRAAVVVLDIASLLPVAQAVARQATRFPYVPGYLSFREVPAVLAAMEKLPAGPDLMLCDGQGLAHPRRFGLACHLGLLLDIPSIGVAKSRLVGAHKEVPEHKGGWTALEDSDEIIGAVLRTRAGVKPVYVSVGHRICLSTAIEYVLCCTTRFRLPETTRHAHRLASNL